MVARPNIEPDDARALRRLALNDDRFLESILSSTDANLEMSGLDARTHALVRLGAVLALDVSPATLSATVGQVLEAGGTPADVVGALIAVMPSTGSARTVARAPTVALELGYDVDAALETLE